MRHIKTDPETSLKDQILSNLCIKEMKIVMDYIPLNKIRIHEYILIYRRKGGRKEGGEVGRGKEKRKERKKERKKRKKKEMEKLIKNI